MSDADTRGGRPLLPPKEAAEYLGVSERWVRESAQLRRLPYVRVGAFLRFDPDDLDDFRKHNRVEAVEV